VKLEEKSDESAEEFNNECLEKIRTSKSPGCPAVTALESVRLSFLMNFGA